MLCVCACTLCVFCVRACVILCQSAALLNRSRCIEESRASTIGGAIIFVFVVKLCSCSGVYLALSCGRTIACSSKEEYVTFLELCVCLSLSVLCVVDHITLSVALFDLVVSFFVNFAPYLSGHLSPRLHLPGGCEGRHINHFVT